MTEFSARQNPSLYKASQAIIRLTFNNNKRVYANLLMLIIGVSSCEMILIALNIILLSIILPSLVNTRFYLLTYILDIIEKYSVRSMHTQIVMGMIVWLAISAITVARLYGISRIYYFSGVIGSYISNLAYSSTLKKELKHIVNQDNGAIITNMSVNANQLVNGGIIPLMISASNITGAVLLLGVAFLAYPIYSFFIFAPLAVIYSLAGIYCKPVLDSNSKKIAVIQSKLITIVNSSLQDYRSVILGISNIDYIREYSSFNKQLRYFQAQNTYIASAPRLGIEPLVLPTLLVVILIWKFSGATGTESENTNVGVLLIILQRALPILQQVFSSFTLLRSNSAAIIGLCASMTKTSFKQLNALSVKQIDSGISYPLKTIQVKDVSFSHSLRNSKPLLSIPFLEMEAKTSYALTGKSGSGKSSLLDLLLGINKPTHGSIRYGLEPNCGDQQVKYISPEEFIKMVPISYCSQSPFLQNNTILSNITQTENSAEVDTDWLSEVIEACELSLFISSLPKGLETYIGDNGQLLSGGQRQRISLATAIYRKPSFIILDESTSALDRDTELRVVAKTLSLLSDATIIFSTHSLSIAQVCSNIIRIENGEVSLKTHA